jgi:hypothetical protein
MIAVPSICRAIFTKNAAKTLDLDVPPLLLGRADDVIE